MSQASQRFNDPYACKADAYGPKYLLVAQFIIYVVHIPSIASHS